MYHENIQKKKGEEKRKIHFLPHKRSEIGIGWQSIAWLEGFQTGRVSGTRPRYHRIAHRTGLPRNKRLRRCGNVGASKQVLFGPGKQPEARGEGRGGCPPPLLIYSILAEYGRRARRGKSGPALLRVWMSLIVAGRWLTLWVLTDSSSEYNGGPRQPHNAEPGTIAWNYTCTYEFA